MAEFGGVRGLQLRTGRVAADLLQGPADTVGVAGELHRRGIGQELPLATDRGLDQVAKKRPGITEHQQCQAEDILEHHALAAVRGRTARARIAAQHPVPDQADQQDAVEQGDQAHVEAHVAVVDMTELMGDHALQLFTAEQADGAAGHADHRVLGTQAGGEGVDADIVEDIHRGHRRARGQGHFLDDIEQAALLEVLRREVDQATAQALGDHLAAGVQLHALVQAAAQHHGDHHQRHDADQRSIQQRRATPARRLAIEMPDQRQGEAGQGNQAGDRQRHQQNQASGLTPGAVLVFKEIHRVVRG